MITINVQVPHKVQLSDKELLTALIKNIVPDECWTEFGKDGIYLCREDHCRTHKTRLNQETLDYYNALLAALAALVQLEKVRMINK